LHEPRKAQTVEVRVGKNPPKPAVAVDSPELDLIGRNEVCRLCGGIKGVTLYEWMKNNDFPRPIILGPVTGRSSTNAWHRTEVLGWLAQRPRREYGKGAHKFQGLRAGERAQRSNRYHTPSRPRPIDREHSGAHENKVGDAKALVGGIKVSHEHLLALPLEGPHKREEVQTQIKPAEQKLTKPKAWLAQVRNQHPQQQNESHTDYARRLHGLMKAAPVSRVWNEKTLYRRLYDK
jgi:predicted DNA-binding transcriptional regulator AlpA